MQDLSALGVELLPKSEVNIEYGKPRTLMEVREDPSAQAIRPLIRVYSGPERPKSPSSALLVQAAPFEAGLRSVGELTGKVKLGAQRTT